MSSAGGNKEMQHLDVTKTEAAWSSLAGNVYVPHSEEEYHRLVALLDSFIDEIGETNHILSRRSWKS
jgi:hypothetical protein